MASTIKRLTGLDWREQKSAVLIGFGHASTHWILATFYLVMPFALKDLGISLAQYALLGSVFHISSAVTNLGSGPMVDISGRKIIFLVISLVVGGMAFLGFLLSPTFPVMIALVALIGASNNLWHPPALAFLSQRFPQAKGFVFSLHVEGASAADSLAPLVAGALVAWLSWQGSITVGAVPAFLAAGLTATILLASDKPPAGGDDRRGMTFTGFLVALKSMLRNRGVVSLCVLSGFRNIVLNSLLVFLPLYLARELQFPEIGVGATMFGLQVGALLGTPFAGIAADRFSRRSIMLVGLTLSTAALLAIVAIENELLFVAGVSFLGFVLFCLRPVIQSWVFDLTPSNAGATATSLLFGTQSVLSAIGIAIGGIVAEIWNLHAVFIMLAGTIMIANALVFLLPRKDVRR